MSRLTRRSGSWPRALIVAAVLTVALAACSDLQAEPSPTPTDFGGIVVAFGQYGISVSNPKSGDAGCSDPNLIPTAISFSASGLGLANQPLRIYIFGSDAAYHLRRIDVDTCIARWARDPATFETVDASPYVLAGQGPWPDAVKPAFQAALRLAAGAAPSGSPPPS